jgi:hypothetical protein
VAADLLSERLLSARPGHKARRRLGFAAAGASSSGRGGAEADDLLAEGFGR